MVKGLCFFSVNDNAIFGSPGVAIHQTMSKIYQAVQNKDVNELRKAIEAEYGYSFHSMISEKGMEYGVSLVPCLAFLYLQLVAFVQLLWLFFTLISLVFVWFVWFNFYLFGCRCLLSF
jgi:hypothetical protein